MAITPVTDLVATRNPANGRITLNWTPANNTDSDLYQYYVLRSAGDEWGYQEVAYLQPTTAWTDATPAIGWVNYGIIAEFDDLSVSEMVVLEDVVYKGVDIWAPDAPVVSGSVTNDLVFLSWAPVADNPPNGVGLDQYTVYRDGVVVGTVSESGSSYSETLVPGTYVYRVSAVDLEGNTSPYSNEVTVIVLDVGDGGTEYEEPYDVEPSFIEEVSFNRAGLAGFGQALSAEPLDDPNKPSALESLQINLSSARWETARTSHVWLHPERVNLVANSSFEVGGFDGPTMATVRHFAEVNTSVSGGSLSFSIPEPPDDADLYIYVIMYAGPSINYGVHTMSISNPDFITYFNGGSSIIGFSRVYIPTLVVSVAGGGTKAFQAQVFPLYGLDLDGGKPIVSMVDSSVHDNLGIKNISGAWNVDGGRHIKTEFRAGPGYAYEEGNAVLFVSGGVPFDNAGFGLPFGMGTTDIEYVTAFDPLVDSGHVNIALAIELAGLPSETAFGWRTNGSISVVPNEHEGGPRPIGDNTRSRVAYLTGGDEVVAVGAIGGLPAVMANQIVLESALAPLAHVNDAHVSLSAHIAGVGQARIGIVIWDGGVSSQFSAGDWTTLATEGAFQRLVAVLPVPETANEVQVRIEMRGERFWVDNVMLDTNAAQLPYFDGATTDSLEGDYAWYGNWGVNAEAGQPIHHTSFSVYYNNRKNMDAWLFGQYSMSVIDKPIGELTLRAGSGPTDAVEFHESVGARTVYEYLTYYSVSTCRVIGTPASGTTRPVRGHLELIDLVRQDRTDGAAWAYTPEGSDLVAHWDQIYDRQLPTWPGGNIIPVKDISHTTPPITI